MNFWALLLCGLAVIVLCLFKMKNDADPMQAASWRGALEQAARP